MNMLTLQNVSLFLLIEYSMGNSLLQSHQFINENVEVFLDLKISIQHVCDMQTHIFECDRLPLLYVERVRQKSNRVRFSE